MLYALEQKKNYIEESIKINARNIAHADIEGVTRYDMKPFEYFMKKPQVPFFVTQNPIRRDFEMMSVAKNAIEHDTLIQIIKANLRLYKIASSKNV